MEGPPGGGRYRPGLRRRGHGSDGAVLARRGPVADGGAVRRGEHPAGRGGAAAAVRRPGRRPGGRPAPRRGVRRGGGPGGDLPGRRSRVPRCPAHPGADRHRAVLRRVRGSPAGAALAVRRAGQPGPRPRPAQTILRLVRFRAAGRGRRRHGRAVVAYPAQLPPRPGPEDALERDRCRGADPGGAAAPHAGGTVALELQPRSRRPPLAKRSTTADPSAADGSRRRAGGGMAGVGRLPGQRAGRALGRPRPGPCPPDRRRLSHRGARCGRPGGPAAPPRVRADPRPSGGVGGALTARPRDPHRPALHLPRRRAARGTADESGPSPPRAGGRFPARARRGARTARSGVDRRGARPRVPAATRSGRAARSPALAGPLPAGAGMDPVVRGSGGGRPGRDRRRLLGADRAPISGRGDRRRRPRGGGVRRRSPRPGRSGHRRRADHRGTVARGCPPRCTGRARPGAHGPGPVGSVGRGYRAARTAAGAPATCWSGCTPRAEPPGAGGSSRRASPIWSGSWPSGSTCRTGRSSTAGRGCWRSSSNCKGSSSPQEIGRRRSSRPG